MIKLARLPYAALLLLLAVALLPITRAAADSPSGDWQSGWWLERASRALRGGDGLGEGEDLNQLLLRPREELVARFSHDARFADTVLGFNLELLGFRQDRVRRENGSYQEIIYELPQAIASARSVLASGEDYFRLFDLKQPLYLGPLLRPGMIEPSDSQLDPATLRHQNRERMQVSLDQLITLAQATPPNIPALCAAFEAHEETFIFSRALGLPRTIPRRTMRDPKWYGLVENSCDGTIPPGFDFVASLHAIKDLNARLFAKLEAFEPAAYPVPNLAAMRTLDLSDLGLAYSHSFFTFTVQQTLPNSSTNFDRKRGAYVLKRFFCDDPACMACHFKLDPMAGFFRDLGRNFRDYSARQNISFDDGVVVPRAEYVKAWQPGPDEEHPWNVGFIRSTQKPALNTYGSTVQDLSSLLKTAPEVRRCVVKRLHGYLTSDSQTADGDFLDYLTEQFAAELTAHGSAEAVRTTAARIVLSKAFATPNADPSVCYDHRPDHVPGPQAPCRVASILAKNCVTCHDSVEKKPFLNLASWARQPDGVYGFDHRTRDGHAIPAGDTYKDIYSRLASTDPDDRMPLNRDMPATDRAELYQWVDAQLHGGAAR